jgi:cytochrome bd ubiquinol oxidase subunit I
MTGERDKGGLYMDVVLLARWQFAITSVYHYLFVPLTLGLSILVALMEIIYVRTGNETYKEMVKFWGKLFLINFAMGVVTGIVQEFHFGMNWSEYSRFVGDIFGAPLAIEALTAFYLESVLIGVWLFGWDKIPKTLHAVVMALVAFATNLSAFWILAANSFMQNPVGFTINNGRAEMTDILALLTNPYVAHQYPHTVLGGFVTAAFFVMGISAYHLLRGNQLDFFRRSFKIGLLAGIISILLSTTTGHFQGQFLVKVQPMKMAAAEAHWDSADPAPFNVIALIDEQKQTNSMELQVPALLSFLSYNTFTGEVKGMKELQNTHVNKYGPGNYIPPVAVTFWSFRIMLAAGGALVLISLYSLYLLKTGQLESKPWMLKLLLWSIPLPYIANSSGWIMAEVGRQPWIVQGLQHVEAGVSPAVSAGSIWLTLIGFTLVYGILAVVDVYLLVKYSKKGFEKAQPNDQIVSKGDVLWN